MATRRTSLNRTLLGMRSPGWARGRLQFPDAQPEVGDVRALLGRRPRFERGACAEYYSLPATVRCPCLKALHDAPHAGCQDILLLPAHMSAKAGTQRCSRCEEGCLSQTHHLRAGHDSSIDVAPCCHSVS